MSSSPDASPTLSICIPTYNRHDYLAYLLNQLSDSVQELHYSYEIVISDNASTDSTEELVLRYQNKLPIRFYKRDRNYGAEDNFEFALNQALGQFQVYLADDDGLILAEVNDILRSMIADREIGVVYAPFEYFDCLTNESGGLCYDLATTYSIDRGHIEELLNCVLQHHIVPETFICRRNVFLAIRPRIGTQAYWAFVHATDYALASKVVFQKTPFYRFHTRDLAGQMPRHHVGWTDLRVNWDLYRGGLEYMLSRIDGDLDRSSLTEILLKIQTFIAIRIAIALRFHLNDNRNIFECYFLTCRLKAMGYSNLSPISSLELATRAGLMFLCTDSILLAGVTEIVCAGQFDKAAQEYLRTYSSLPVSFVSSAPSPSEISPNSLLCMAAKEARCPIEKHVDSGRIVWFENLISKFS